MITESTACCPAAATSWNSAECSESTGSSGAFLLAANPVTSPPAQTRLSLLASATGSPLLKRRDSRFEAGEAHDGVEHQVGFDLPHQPRRAPGSRSDTHPRVEGRRDRGRGGLVGYGDIIHAERRGLLEQTGEHSCRTKARLSSGLCWRPPPEGPAHLWSRWLQER